MTEYRLLVLGTAAVGKSTITLQYVQNVFVDVYNPTVEDSYRKAINIDDEFVMLGFFCSEATLYSITSKFSFTQVAQFHEDILQIKDSNEAPIVIVGNKCDMEQQREVPTEMGKKYADKFNIPFFETSAKTKVNVDESFKALVKQIIKYNPEKTKKKYRKDRRSGILHCTLM